MVYYGLLVLITGINHPSGKVEQIDQELKLPTQQESACLY